MQSRPRCAAAQSRHSDARARGESSHATKYSSDYHATEMSEKAVKSLQEQWFCVLATASPQAEPWVSPLFYNFDARYHIVWESAKDAHHSRLIADNPAIAIVVANFAKREADEAVYLVCKAREVPPEGLSEALDTFVNGAHKRTPEVERRVEMYLGDSPQRLYEAQTESAYLLVVTTDPDGRRLDRRQKISLAGA
jgi:nitroimidazol reductase NimA-like FMN-containing flavoprotein (pyridoxamine 5'-phosphate oxidase superfamily)